MKIEKFIKSEKEKPLDNILSDGGFTAIFRTIACIGDSLSSGEFETVNEERKKCYNDLYEYSWGQFIARCIGSKVYNFSRGGMTAKWYLDTFADENDLFNPDKKCQCYIIALGVNDVSEVIGEKYEFGNIEDVKKDNLETFCGNYGKIIKKYKEISPDAKFFLMSCPFNSFDEEKRNILYDKHQSFLYELCEYFENTYILNFRKYAPDYGKEFKDYFYLNGHLNPAGYLMTSKMVMSYIDFIIRNNPRDFDEVGLINTGIKNYK